MTAFDHTELDDVIHGRLRLGVMAYLSTVSPATFVELRAKVNATDGNLSAHLSKLEDASYLRIEKSFAGKKPVTQAHLTDAGRAALIAYLDRLKALLSAAECAAFRLERAFSRDAPWARRRARQSPLRR